MQFSCLCSRSQGFCATPVETDVITDFRFEELNADLFRGTLDPVEKSLRDAKLDKGKPPV